MKIKGKYIRGSLLHIATLIFIFAFLFNEAEGAETWGELGPSIISYEHSDSFTLLLQERWNNKYAVALGYISEQHFNTCPSLENRPDCIWDVRSQLMIGAERLIQGNFDSEWLGWANRLTFSIGPYWFQNTNRVTSCHFNIRLTLAIELWEGAAIKAGHFSHGGTCKEITLENPNLMVPAPGSIPGRLAVGVPIQITGDWNLGQDALLFAWRF